jgi:hypothetical protein
MSKELVEGEESDEEEEDAETDGGREGWGQTEERRGGFSPC